MMRCRLVSIAIVIATVAVIVPASAQQRAVPSTQAEVQLSFAPLVEKITPAVVNIYTQKIITSRQMTPLFDDPFFRQFFGNLAPRLGQQQRQQQNSLGSGVIVRGDGMIVTNLHVIEGADKVNVVLADRREFDAMIVGSDEQSDLSVLKIDPGNEKLPHLELRDSDELKVGDLVLAVGNPFGVGQTVTSGIVSALARSIGSEKQLKSFIQTDAAINPGNSGGALVSMDGRLVGVNTAIFSKSGGSHGIGFAIPSNMVRAVVNGLEANGKLVRPWLGAYGQAVTSDIAMSLGMQRPLGVIVSQVHSGGSAGRAGVRPGDVVLALNGHEIETAEDLAYRVATLPVGDTAALRVLRGGKIIPLTVDLEPAPDTPLPNPTEIGGRTPLSGAVVANVSPAFAVENGLNPFDSGVVITKIRNGSVAGRLNFQPGDLVKAVNGRDVDDVDALKDATSAEDLGEWRIRVERNGKSQDLIFRG